MATSPLSYAPHVQLGRLNTCSGGGPPAKASHRAAHRQQQSISLAYLNDSEHQALTLDGKCARYTKFETKPDPDPTNRQPSTLNSERSACHLSAGLVSGDSVAQACDNLDVSAGGGPCSVPAASADLIQCAICHEPVGADAEEAVALTPCKHTFHEACITPWFERGNETCPMCRSHCEQNLTSRERLVRLLRRLHSINEDMRDSRVERAARQEPTSLSDRMRADQAARFRIELNRLRAGELHISTDDYHNRLTDDYRAVNQRTQRVNEIRQNVALTRGAERLRPVLGIGFLTRTVLSHETNQEQDSKELVAATYCLD